MPQSCRCCNLGSTGQTPWRTSDLWWFFSRKPGMLLTEGRRMDTCWTLREPGKASLGSQRWPISTSASSRPSTGHVDRQFLWAGGQDLHSRLDFSRAADIWEIGEASAVTSLTFLNLWILKTLSPLLTNLNKNGIVKPAATFLFLVVPLSQKPAIDLLIY